MDFNQRFIYLKMYRLYFYWREVNIIPARQFFNKTSVISLDAIKT